MPYGIGLLLWVLTLGAAGVLAQVRSPLDIPSTQAWSRLDSLRFKADSLERAIRKSVIDDKDKAQLTSCARTKRGFLEEMRAQQPELAQLDAKIREKKLSGVSMHDPEVGDLMERKFIFEQTFENLWQNTAEAKRCAAGDEERRRRGDAALTRHQGWKRLQKTLEAESKGAM